jgi:hypothetical protein
MAENLEKKIIDELGAVQHCIQRIEQINYDTKKKPHEIIGILCKYGIKNYSFNNNSVETEEISGKTTAFYSKD